MYRVQEGENTRENYYISIYPYQAICSLHCYIFSYFIFSQFAKTLNNVCKVFR